MINPLQLLTQFQQAQNPMALMSQFCGNNPQMKQVLDNLQNKSPQELEQYARNMAKSRNTDLKQFLGQFGLNIN
jgi:hypothetical protein